MYLNYVAYGIQYEGETYEQMKAREARMRRIDFLAEMNRLRWLPWPMRSLWDWCRTHAPDRLPPWHQHDSYEDWHAEQMAEYDRQHPDGGGSHE